MTTATRTICKALCGWGFARDGEYQYVNREPSYSERVFLNRKKFLTLSGREVSPRSAEAFVDVRCATSKEVQARYKRIGPAAL